MLRRETMGLHGLSAASFVQLDPRCRYPERGVTRLQRESRTVQFPREARAIVLDAPPCVTVTCRNGELACVRTLAGAAPLLRSPAETGRRSSQGPHLCPVPPLQPRGPRRQPLSPLQSHWVPSVPPAVLAGVCPWRWAAHSSRNWKDLFSFHSAMSSEESITRSESEKGSHIPVLTPKLTLDIMLARPLKLLGGLGFRARPGLSSLPCRREGEATRLRPRAPAVMAGPSLDVGPPVTVGLGSQACVLLGLGLLQELRGRGGPGWLSLPSLCLSLILQRDPCRQLLSPSFSVIWGLDSQPSFQHLPLCSPELTLLSTHSGLSPQPPACSPQPPARSP